MELFDRLNKFIQACPVNYRKHCCFQLNQKTFDSLEAEHEQITGWKLKHFYGYTFVIQPLFPDETIVFAPLGYHPPKIDVIVKSEEERLLLEKIAYYSKSRPVL